MFRFHWYLILMCIGTATVANAATLVVDQSGAGDYITISDALAAADPAGGDVIEIFPGAYGELVAVDRSVDFRGVGGAGSVVINGGGVRGCMTIYGAYVVNISDLTFEDGMAPDTGGAIDIRFDPQVTIQDCQFRNNEAAYDLGALGVRHAGTRVTVINSEFVGNFAPHNGGAAGVLVNGTLELFECRFIDNRSNALAGAVASDSNATLFVERCLFLANEGTIGAILVRSSTGYVRENTLHANIGGLGSIDCVQAAGIVERNIITGNTAGPALMVEYTPFAHGCNVLFDCAGGPVQGTALAPDEVVADPLYCDLPSGDFTVGLVSPAGPAYSPCGQLIGAFPAICALPVPATPSSFSQLKARF